MGKKPAKTKRPKLARLSGPLADPMGLILIVVPRGLTPDSAIG
jgi:hypothetical protein